MIEERYDANGNLIGTVDVPDVPLSPEETNARTLESRLRAHLGRNRDFLALASPTAAQRNVQTERLTRQVSALIRLQLRELGETEADE